MSLRLLGKKLGMTQIFEENGDLTPVTLIELGPNYVVQKKTVEKEGYSALQLGFDLKREKSVSKPEQGHTAKAGLEPLRYLRESRLEPAEAEAYNGPSLIIAYAHCINHGLNLAKGLEQQKKAPSVRAGT